MSVVLSMAWNSSCVASPGSRRVATADRLRARIEGAKGLVVLLRDWFNLLAARRQRVAASLGSRRAARTNSPCDNAAIALGSVASLRAWVSRFAARIASLGSRRGATAASPPCRDPRAEESVGPVFVLMAKASRLATWAHKAAA